MLVEVFGDNVMSHVKLSCYTNVLRMDESLLTMISVQDDSWQTHYKNIVNVWQAIVADQKENHMAVCIELKIAAIHDSQFDPQCHNQWRVMGFMVMILRLSSSYHSRSCHSLWRKNAHCFFISNELYTNNLSLLLNSQRGVLLWEHQVQISKKVNEQQLVSPPWQHVHPHIIFLHFWASKNTVVIPHPSYSPDIILCNFFLFPQNEASFVRLPFWHNYGHPSWISEGILSAYAYCFSRNEKALIHTSLSHMFYSYWHELLCHSFYRRISFIFGPISDGPEVFFYYCSLMSKN